MEREEVELKNLGQLPVSSPHVESSLYDLATPVSMAWSPTRSSGSGIGEPREDLKPV
jgi:hypothetical protein